MTRCPQRRHGRAQQNDVAQGARADEKDVQGRKRVRGYGISIRPVDRLPRRSDARTTTTCGAGPVSSPIANS